MVAELTQNIAGWDRIEGAMDEIHACHEETLNFFSGTFDQLDSLCGLLLSREQQIERPSSVQSATNAVSPTVDETRWNTLEKAFEEDRLQLLAAQQNVQQQVAQLTTVADELASTRNEFQTIRDELVRHNETLAAAGPQTLVSSGDCNDDKSELGDTLQAVQEQIAQLMAVAGDLKLTRNEFQTVRTELVQHKDELTAVRSQTLDASRDIEEDRSALSDTRQTVQEQVVQLSAVVGDLESARNEFQTVREELTKHNEELAEVRAQTLAASKVLDADIKNKIDDMEKEQALLAKDREAMEKELESVRTKASEMTELLAEQKRLASPQQSQWAEELQQMRTLLEVLARQMTEQKKHIDPSPLLQNQNPAWRRWHRAIRCWNRF